MHMTFDIMVYISPMTSHDRQNRFTEFIDNIGNNFKVGNSVMPFFNYRFTEKVGKAPTGPNSTHKEISFLPRPKILLHLLEHKTGSNVKVK